MTAPGLNLEFLEGPGFRQRSRTVPGLAEAVLNALRDAPPLKGLQAWELTHAGRAYGILLERRGQRVSLMHIFRLPDEGTAFSARIQELMGRRRPGERQ